MVRMSLASLLKNGANDFKFGFVINDEESGEKKKKNKNKKKKDVGGVDGEIKSDGVTAREVFKTSVIDTSARKSDVKEGLNGMVVVTKKVEPSPRDNRLDHVKHQGVSATNTKKDEVVTGKTSKDPVSTSVTRSSIKINKSEKKKEKKKVIDDFDDVLESFSLTTVSTVSAVPASSKKSIIDPKVFFVSPNDPEIDNATKMKLKFGNGMNLVAKGPTKVRDPTWISDGAPKELNVTPFTFGFGSLFTNNS